MIRLSCFVICLFLTLLSIEARELNRNSDLPDFNVILSAQLRCDDSELAKIPWDKRYRDVWKLAYKTVSILSDIQIVKDVRFHEKDNRKRQDIKFQYTPYGRIICGEQAEIEEKAKPTVELLGIAEAYNRPGFFDIYDDNNPMRDTTYLSHMKYTDQPNPAGMDGMACLVELSNFLANPLKAIDLKKLCKGESKAKIETTKKEILRVAGVLSKQQAQANIQAKKSVEKK